MKKIFGIAFAMILCFAISMCAFAYSLEFNTDGDFEGMTLGAHAVNSKVENGELYFEIEKRDPQLYIDHKKYNATTKKGGVGLWVACKII